MIKNKATGVFTVIISQNCIDSLKNHIYRLNLCMKLPNKKAPPERSVGHRIYTYKLFLFLLFLPHRELAGDGKAPAKLALTPGGYRAGNKPVLQ